MILHVIMLWTMPRWSVGTYNCKRYIQLSVKVQSPIKHSVTNIWCCNTCEISLGAWPQSFQHLILNAWLSELQMCHLWYEHIYVSGCAYFALRGVFNVSFLRPLISLHIVLFVCNILYALFCSGYHRKVWPAYGEYAYCPPQRWMHNLEVQLTRDVVCNLNLISDYSYSMVPLCSFTTLVPQQVRCSYSERLLIHAYGGISSHPIWSLRRRR